MTRYSRGDIVLVPFPFTDLRTTKQRPALIISPDHFHQTSLDVMLAAITSQDVVDGPLTIDDVDCLEGRLPKRSIVKPTKLFTMHSGMILQRLCRLRPDKLEMILMHVRQLFT